MKDNQSTVHSESLFIIAVWYTMIILITKRSFYEEIEYKILRGFVFLLFVQWHVIKIV